MAGFNAVTDKTSTLELAGFDFWPGIRVADFQRDYRLPAEYAERLLLDHLALARIWAIRQLRAWEGRMRAEGYTRLADVPLYGMEGGQDVCRPSEGTSQSPSPAGSGGGRHLEEGCAQRLFRRAVFCHAKALLLGQFATMDRREAARNEAKEGADTEARFQAWAVEAIADLLDRPRITVGLV